MANKNPMQLPPSIQGKVRENKRHRRDRIRIELSQAHGKWMLGMITDSIKAMDIESTEFRNAYQLFRSISDQLEKLKPK